MRPTEFTAPKEDEVFYPARYLKNLKPDVGRIDERQASGALHIHSFVFLFLDRRLYARDVWRCRSFHTGASFVLSLGTSRNMN